jgi:LytS/YehU family sensor histidine kinase
VFYFAVVAVIEAVRWWSAYRALSRARLDALASQLQPHFLFNALHAASSLIDTDPPAARKTLVRLSDLLRATLDVKQHTVPLSEELALLDLYLDIQRIRFHDRLTVTIDVAPDAALVRVPPLLLQPLVENAIRHGIGTKPDAGTIAITARRARGRVTITVADDGVGLPADHAERIGLGTTRERLLTLFPDARFELRSRSAGGTEAVIEVPA